MKTCYYELLDVPRTASQTDLKKAYRKKALELHPDKNIGRESEATALFAEVQEAYEILSDEQERAWYDSHREQILSGWDGTTPSSSGYGHSEESLMPFFSPSCYKGFNDSDSGFFSVYRKLFEEIEAEEREALQMDSEALAYIYDSVPIHTSFGTSTDSYLSTILRTKDGQFTLKDFYDKFTNFCSCKSFRWFDKYRLSDAPDRRVKRLMEKDNKKQRDSKRRDYNETVRNLALFVRKRDPRYKAHIQAVKEEQEAKQKEIQDRIKQQKMEQLEKAQEFVEQDWMKVDVDKELGLYSDEYSDYDEEDEEEQGEELDENESISQEDDEDDVYDLYCVACDKEFKTEQQMHNHEQSKKHLKAVKLLKREMMKEEGLTYDEIQAVEHNQDLDIEQLVEEKVTKEKKKKTKNNNIPVDPSSELDEKPVSRKNKGKRNKRQDLFGNEDFEQEAVSVDEITAGVSESLQISNESEPSITPATTHKKKNKSKKGNKKENSKDSSEWKCNTCQEEFQTRNKLFQHIKESGHAFAGTGKKSK